MSDQPNYVPPTGEAAPQTPQSPVQPTGAPVHKNNGMAITSMILGILSVVMAGLLTGIPAIILGIIDLKKKQGEKAFNITGIATGAIGTAFSLIAIAFVIFIVVIGAQATNSRQNSDSYRDLPRSQQEL